MTVYWATKNPGKLTEFRLAAPAGITLDAMPGLSAWTAPEETGATFQENAILKANYYSVHAPAGELVFADDSGLEVAALNGSPGVYSARYSGPGATDASNNAFLLEQMQGMTDRSARFVCSIALSKDGHTVGTFWGAVDGEILMEPRGSNGFGYDPLFYCPALGCTLAEADDRQKLSVSHRGAALASLFRFLATMSESQSAS